MMNKEDEVITLDILIRERPYQIACAAAEKESVLDLVNKFDNLVLSISDGNKGSDALIFLIAGLKLEDKIKEVENKLKLVTAEIEKYKNNSEHNLQAEAVANNLCRYIVARIDKIVLSLGVSENVGSNCDVPDQA